ncbi:MAG: radical SAM protein [Omnitrophica WOR_2 bacterium SM23_29]|nr:MAG: radical SAM protein [Omnitrophica WOR_2 bacterium SM23_29]
MSSEKVDLLIIKPGSQKELYGELSETLTGLEPPLWAALLAAFVRERGFEVKLVDAEVTPEYLLPAITEYSAGLIAIVVSGTNPSASTMNMVGARAILEKIKSVDSDAPTILTGLHPSALPERTMKEESVSIVCQGEGFYTLVDLLSHVPYKDVRGLWRRDSGKVLSNPPADLINLSELPVPAWDLLPMDKYRAHNWHSWSNKNQSTPYGTIYTSLGCPYNCSFCCINAIFGKHKIRYRDPKLVINDIDYLVKNYGVKNIKIIDEMFALNEGHVTKLCDLIIERKYDLNIWAYARVDTLSDKMLKSMKQAGFNWLAVGFESGSKKIRDGVTKGRFGNEEMLKIVRKIREAGINIVGNFIFGLPDDDPETMRDTLNMAKELNCEYTNFYVCMAHPGCRLYEESNPTDLPNSWLGFSQFGYETSPLPTKYLRPEEILRFRDNAFKEFYTSENYQKMIYEKFGEATLQNIKEMLKYKLKRRLLGD